MLSQFFVRLTYVERAALARLADAERRDTRAQAAVLIAEGLQRRGLIEALMAAQTPPAPASPLAESQQAVPA